MRRSRLPKARQKKCFILKLEGYRGRRCTRHRGHRLDLLYPTTLPFSFQCLPVVGVQNGEDPRQAHLTAKR